MHPQSCGEGEGGGGGLLYQQSLATLSFTATVIAVTLEYRATLIYKECVELLTQWLHYTGRKKKENNLTTTELAKYSFTHLGEFDLGVTDWFREAHDDESGLLSDSWKTNTKINHSSVRTHAHWLFNNVFLHSSQSTHLSHNCIIYQYNISIITI